VNAHPTSGALVSFAWLDFFVAAFAQMIDEQRIGVPLRLSLFN